MASFSKFVKKLINGLFGNKNEERTFQENRVIEAHDEDAIETPVDSVQLDDQESIIDITSLNKELSPINEPEETSSAVYSIEPLEDVLVQEGTGFDPVLKSLPRTDTGDEKAQDEIIELKCDELQGEEAGKVLKEGDKSESVAYKNGVYDSERISDWRDNGVMMNNHAIIECDEEGDDLKLGGQLLQQSRQELLNVIKKYAVDKSRQISFERKSTEEDSRKKAIQQFINVLDNIVKNFDAQFIEPNGNKDGSPCDSLSLDTLDSRKRVVSEPLATLNKVLDLENPQTPSEFIQNAFESSSEEYALLCNDAQVNKLVEFAENPNKEELSEKKEIDYTGLIESVDDSELIVENHVATPQGDFEKIFGASRDEDVEVENGVAGNVNDSGSTVDYEAALLDETSSEGKTVDYYEPVDIQVTDVVFSGENDEVIEGRVDYDGQLTDVEEERLSNQTTDTSLMDSDAASSDFFAEDVMSNRSNEAVEGSTASDIKHVHYDFKSEGDLLQLANETRSLEEIMEVRKEYYKEDSVELVGFSVRAGNIFKRNKLFKVSDILQLSPVELREFKNLGKTTFQEIIAKLYEYCKQKNVISTLSIEEKKEMQVLLPYRDSILQQSWEELLKCEINDVAKAKIQVYSLIDHQLLELCTVHPEMVQNMVSGLASFYESNLPNDEYNTILNLLEKNIPEKRKHNLVHGYIVAYTNQEGERSVLEKWCQDEELSIRGYFSRIRHSIITEDEFNVIKCFGVWLSFDLESDISIVTKELFRNDRERQIVEARSKKNTLEQIGRSQSLTRERVRQIELKVRHRLSVYLAQTSVIKKIFAEKQASVMLTPLELSSIFGREGDSIVFLMRFLEHRDYIYDAELDVFFAEQSTSKEIVLKYVDGLPNIFTEKDMPSILQRGEDTYGLPTELIRKTIEERYRKTGNRYHQKRLSLQSIYAEVLKKYYPDGIHVYDDAELSEFRNRVYDLFGKIEIPQGNRALSAGLSRDNLTILCGRGKYTLTKDEYIPDDLVRRIKAYIDGSKQGVLLVSSVFNEFQDELEKYGIDNRYYLHGVLRHQFGDVYSFRRDYIVKDEGGSNIYTAIQTFIKSSEYPVSKDDIRINFPGITDIMISMAITDKSILKLWRSYYDAERLTFTSKEKAIIDAAMKKRVFNGPGYAHVKDIYDELNNRIPYALTRNSINMSYDLLSVLAYLYSKKCVISRPYIAKRGIEIGKAEERMQEFIANNSLIDIASISEYAKKIHLNINSMLTFLEGYFDKYLLINNKQIASYNYIGIDRPTMEKIDLLLQEEVTETIAIRELQCAYQLPTLNVHWNEWLLYSIEKAVSTQLEVKPSDSQIRMAIPLIAPKGEMSKDYDIHTIESYQNGDLAQGQNIDNIDELIEDFIEELFDDEFA